MASTETLPVAGGGLHVPAVSAVLWYAMNLPSTDAPDEVDVATETPQERSARFERKMMMAPLNGSSSSADETMAASPSMPLRKSTGSVAT